MLSIFSMGCCCSKEDDESVHDEPNMRTRLLQDQPGNGYQTNNSSNEFGTNYGSVAQQKGDDQTALHKVLQEIANKVIDVGAVHCQTLEGQEYDDRSRLYAQTINRLSIPQNLLTKNPKLLLIDVPPSDRSFANPVSSADFIMISNASNKVMEALSKIKVEHKGDLVVQFGRGQ